MVRRKFLHSVEGDRLSYDDRSLCGATNFIMMEVGRATSSSMMKERGATKSNSRNYIHKVIFIFVVIDMRLYIS